MRFNLLLPLTFIAGILAGCTPPPNYYTQTVQSWRGANVNNLIEQWGSPDDKISRPNGNVLFLYNSETYPTPRPTSPQIGVNVGSTGTPVITTPSTDSAMNQNLPELSCSTLFEINKNSTIVNVTSQGNACYASEVFAQAKTNSHSHY